MLEYIFSINNVKALLITLVVEILVILLFKEKKLKIYLCSVIMNIITNLTFNSITPFLPFENYNLYIILLEILIVIIESLIYLMISKKTPKSLKYGFLCNLLSYIIGMLLIPYIY